MFVEMLGRIDAEDIEERGNDGHYSHVQNAGNQQTEEHLCNNMQGMSSKRAVVHPSVAYNEQNGCQNVGKGKTVSP